MQLFTVNAIGKNHFDHIKTEQLLLDGDILRTDQGRAIIIHSRGSILVSHGKKIVLSSLLGKPESGQYQPASVMTRKVSSKKNNA